MNTENNNDEIDLMQIFSMIKEGFRKFLRLIISVVTFYKRKWVLFVVLLIAGAGIGFFLDKYQDAGDNYVQEIIIEPKYNTVRYIHDFITEIENNLNDEAFLKKIGVDPDKIENLKEISIEPIVRGTDVLDNLESRYENKEFFKSVMEAYEDEELNEEKFKDFYKHHRLILRFKNGNKENLKITDAILNYIKSNEHYKKEIKLVIQQYGQDLEQNQKTLQFINEYLTNLSKNTHKSEKEIIVVTDEDELPTMSITSLLQQKEVLMETIKKQQKVLIFDKEVFTIVDYGTIISKKKVLLSNIIFMIPLILFIIVSLFFFLRYLYREANEFVNNK